MFACVNGYGGYWTKAKLAVHWPYHPTLMKYIIAVILLLGSCLSSCSKSEGVPSNDPAPVADFTYSAPATAQDTITFKNTSVNTATYEWDFGDGATSHEQNPDHIFKQPGTYTVILITYGRPGSTISNDIAMKKVSIGPSQE